MEQTAVRRLLSAVWRRLLREESGIALVMALGVMTTLSVSVATATYLSATGARDAALTNTGQRASALAEAGINNAVAVLNANYPGTALYPGDSTLLPARTTTFSTGSVTWGGSLVQAPPGAGWGYEWDISATGDFKNPTGPASDVKRTITAVVPVVLPTTSQQSSTTSAINFIYAKQNITFGQSLNVEAPVYAGGNLTLQNTATISEDIPASLTAPARKNKVAVAGSLTLSSPQNQIGHVDSNTNPAGQLAELHVVGTCSSQNHTTPHSPCDEGDPPHANQKDPIWATINDTAIPAGFVTPPTMTCCQPVPYASPVTSNSAASSSYLGFWYQVADLGPNSPCDPSQSSGAYPTFDNDTTMNQSAYAVGAPFNLTGSPYVCISRNGNGKLTWDGSQLTIKGTVFFDGSVCIGSSGCGTNGGGQYSGTGSIILTGAFTIGNHDTMCIQGALVSGNCNVNADWDPNAVSLGIIADGNDGNGNSIAIKQGQIQGLLMGANNVYCDPASGTLVQGPLVSVYGSISCGQSSTLAFPAISFPSSGFTGSTGPLPVPQLLPPTEFSGG